MINQLHILKHQWKFSKNISVLLFICILIGLYMFDILISWHIYLVYISCVMFLFIWFWMYETSIITSFVVFVTLFWGVSLSPTNVYASIITHYSLIYDTMYKFNEFMCVLVFM